MLSPAPQGLGVALSLLSGLGKLIPLSGSHLPYHPTKTRPCPLNFPRNVQSTWLPGAALFHWPFSKNQLPPSSREALTSEGDQGHHSQQLLSKLALPVSLLPLATLAKNRWSRKGL